MTPLPLSTRQERPNPRVVTQATRRGERGLSLVAGQGKEAPVSSPVLLPVCDRDPYHRVAPGLYAAVAVRVQGPEWVQPYRRWSLLIEFELLGERDEVLVCAFFNMGNNPKGPRPGRQSRYFRAWTIANGEQPRKGQVMDPAVFRDGQQFEIEVVDGNKDMDNKVKTDAEVYSKVSRIHSARRPL